jgi:GNAT superfamily N-acetyltransferase
MHWRVPKHGKAWEEAKGEPNRRALERLVRAGEVHAVLAFAGKEPVGWCSFGPRRSFAKLEASRALARPEAADGTRSIVCFYLPARWRGKGVATALLEAATARAFALGATEVEGFPVVPRKPPAPVPAAFAWTGVPVLFERAGFRPIARADAQGRPIYLKRAPPLRVSRPGSPGSPGRGSRSGSRSRNRS